MELFKINDSIYYTDYEQERDRPRLGYIKGKNFSVVIDAGHSDEHVKEFYELLKKNDLPLPELTIITHWHWDHAFGMHSVNGKTIANKNTNKHIQEFIDNRSEENDKKFLAFDPSIALEYKNNKEIIVVTSDIEFENKLTIDVGGKLIEILKAPSPHTDDSTIVYLKDDKVLFVGDGPCGTAPTWIVDQVKAKETIDFISPLDFNISIGGHWPNLDKQGLIEMLLEEQQ